MKILQLTTETFPRPIVTVELELDAGDDVGALIEAWCSGRSLRLSCPATAIDPSSRPTEIPAPSVAKREAPKSGGAHALLETPALSPAQVELLADLRGSGTLQSHDRRVGRALVLKGLATETPKGLELTQRGQQIAVYLAS